MSKKVPHGNPDNSERQKPGLKKWSLIYSLIILILGIILAVVLLHELDTYFKIIGVMCGDEIEEYSVFQKQELRDGHLYVYASFVYCKHDYTGIETCYDTLQPKDLRVYYFEGDDNPLDLVKGDQLKLRWCEIPGVGHRIRGVWKQ